jgi:hypothetical protein
MEQQLEQIQLQAAARMADLGPQAQDEYEKLQAENAAILEETQTKEQELQTLINTVQHYQKRLSDPEYQTHKRGLEMKKRKIALEKQRAELIEETSVSLTPEQLLQKLKAKLRAVEKEIEQTQKTTQMIEGIVESNQVTISNKEGEVQEAKAHKRKADKYEKMYDRDRKMQDFINSYPDLKAKQQQQKETLQRTIVALLTHISKGLQAQKDLPDQKQFEKIKSEVSFKEKRINNSKSTALKLEKELEKKKAALEKMQGLDKKLPVELTQFKTKIRDMKEEMRSFKTPEQLEQEAKEAKAMLSAEKVRTAKDREMLKLRLQLLGHNFDRKKRDLGSNEANKRLEALEQRLRSHAQSSYTLQDYIVTKKRESDWESLAAQSRELTTEINRLNLNASKHVQ